MGKSFTNFHIEDRSFVSFVKREIHLDAGHAHFSENKVGEINIVVSELTSNLIKHAGGGEVLYRITDTGEDESTFEIICIDKGPGMADTLRMMKDGVSTAGTLGHGLGAIERLSSFSQVYSIPGWGTIIYAMISTHEKKFVRKTFPDLDIKALCVNKPREVVCGDGYRIRNTNNGTLILFGDGLGHGEHAKAAFDTAGDFFMSTPDEDPVSIIRQMHEKVRRTRGMVTAVAALDKGKSEWRMCGVGNITVRMYTGIQYKTYMSYNGTVGLNIPTSLKSRCFRLKKINT
jgi:anti-sigma regulatory factor (Ser/Thr protein kinase)